MNLLFIGITPGKDLKKVLSANGIAFHSGRSAPDEEVRFDLILFAPKSLNALTKVSPLRKAHTSAWIQLLVPEKWMEANDAQNALLQCEEINGVVAKEKWESHLWFVLQQAISHAQLLGEFRSLTKDWDTLRDQYEELSRASDILIQQLERDVGMATDIQRSLLPKSSPAIPGVNLAVKYVPAAGLGGDYYDIFEFGDRKRFGILLADSETHGMAAALLGVLLKTRTDEMKDRFPNSQSFVEYLNREIYEHQKNVSSLSVLYGILDRTTLTFSYTAAGHLRPYLWRMGEPEPLEIAGNPAIGSMAHYPFRENELALHPGDLLIFHTDGLEAPLKKKDESAFHRILKILREKDPSPDPLEVQNELMALVNRFVERNTLKDDLTLINLSVDEKALYVPRRPKLVKPDSD